MLLLLAGGALDLSDPITTPPVPGTGVVTQIPTSSGAWRVSLEIAEPPAITTWYDISQFYVGDRYQRGADDYKGKYRASLATVQLQIDVDQAADLEVSADILAPWGQDTTGLFGSNIRIGSGLLMRLSMVREVEDVVVEWLPIWTGRVEDWGDASAARGQIRTHVVSVVDLLADLANVPVAFEGTVEWDDWFTAQLLPAAVWLFGVDIYGDTSSSGLPLVETPQPAITLMDAGTDPLGLVWRTLRSGKLVIHPAPWDTTNTNRYDNPLLDTYPDGLKFSYAPDFTDVEYIADDDQQPFGIHRSTAGVLNSLIVTMPADLGTELYPIDNPVSVGRHGVRPFTATWILSNPPVVDDLLEDRAFSESQALPLRTTIDHEGFWPALAMVDHLDPITVVHATSETGLVVTGTGTVRNIVEERTVRGAGLLNWQSTIQFDIDSTETSEPLLPVENLALVSTESSPLGAPSTATFSWTNPVQPSITPNEVQYRVLGRSLLWLPKSYPGVGSDGLVTYGLNAATQYTFQVRLIRRVDGAVTNFSVWRQVRFTTPAIIFPRPVPDGEDTGGNFPEPPDFDPEDCEMEVELQENDGTGWVTVDTFTDAELTDNGDGTWSLTTPIDNSFFNVGSMYRFRSREVCGGIPGAWTVGPEFDPPDDWTDPCPEPAALSVPPYDEAIVYVPKVCNGGEDGDPAFVFQGMQIFEAISGIPGAIGDALAEIQTGLADPGDHSLLAIPDPEWSDTPFGIVAYGECPQIVGQTGDKTISARVKIVNAVDCVLGEVAGMRLLCVATGGGWRAAVVVYKTGVTITLPTSTELSEGTVYVIDGTFDLATGGVTIAVDGVLDNSVSGTPGVPTINALPIWRVGVPPESWITDFALFGVAIPATYNPATDSDLDFWYDMSQTSSITGSPNVTAQDDLANGFDLTGAANPQTGTRSQNSLNVIDFNEGPELGAGFGGSMNMDATGFTLVMLVKSDGAGNDGYMVKVNATPNEGRWGIYRDTGNLLAIHTLAGGVNENASVADSSTAVRVVTQRIFRSGASSYNELRINGVQVAVNTFTDVGTVYGGAADPQIGAFGALSGYYLDGFVGEVLGQLSFVDDTLLEKREQYLMDKWGV